MQFFTLQLQLEFRAFSIFLFIKEPFSVPHTFHYEHDGKIKQSTCSLDGGYRIITFGWIINEGKRQPIDELAFVSSLIASFRCRESRLVIHFRVWWLKRAPTFPLCESGLTQRELAHKLHKKRVFSFFYDLFAQISIAYCKWMWLHFCVGGLRCKMQSTGV